MSPSVVRARLSKTEPSLPFCHPRESGDPASLPALGFPLSREWYLHRQVARLAPNARRAYLYLMQTVDLTPSAAARVAFIASKQGKPAMLRLSVEGGGCSGFQYRFGLAEGIDADDLVTETDGVKLVVDPMSLDLLDGSHVDYVESLGGSAFRVTNPNAASGCGCGASFSV